MLLSHCTFERVSLLVWGLTGSAESSQIKKLFQANKAVNNTMIRTKIAKKRLIRYIKASPHHFVENIHIDQLIARRIIYSD